MDAADKKLLQDIHGWSKETQANMKNMKENFEDHVEDDRRAWDKIAAVEQQTAASVSKLRGEINKGKGALAIIIAIPAIIAAVVGIVKLFQA